MAEKILVAFATRNGSTKEVAEAMAAALTEKGFDAHALPAKEVSSLDGYKAVVLGAPLYIGALPGDANKFLSRFRADLSAKPNAVFALGPLKDDPVEAKGSREQLDKVLAKSAWLKPAAVEVFAGKFDPSKLGFPFSLLNKLPASPLHNIPATDNRNWEAIRAWAAALPSAFNI